MMKVGELIEILKYKNPDAFVEIKTDKRWTVDIKEVREHDTKNVNVVILTSIHY